jgi:hypothetical protein
MIGQQSPFDATAGWHFLPILIGTPVNCVLQYRGAVVSEVSVQTGVEGLRGADVVAQVRLMLQGKAPVRIADPPPVKSAPAIIPAPQAVPAVTKDVDSDELVVPVMPAQARSSARGYALVCALLTLLGVAAVWKGNQLYGPEMYGADGMVPAAEAASKGLNYAVFDLNINIRHLREETVKRMTTTPDVVILGASHWQEAHAGLIKNLKAYNSHIHRDYWEDPLGVVEIYAKYNRLPKRMIIAVRDNQFVPVSMRKDFLWEPGIPYYRDFADRIGLEKENFWATLPYDRMRALFSLSMLFDNFSRWYNAPEHPHETAGEKFDTLDVLMPDGSIRWARKHDNIFTPERAKRESLSFAAFKVAHPPVIDPKGIEAFDAMLTYLKKQGVQVYLVHPPYNPLFWDAVQKEPYTTAVAKIEEATQKLARDHGLKIFGGFDPAKVGCEAKDYIDSEHANPHCLQKVFDQFNNFVRAEGGA